MVLSVAYLESHLVGPDAGPSAESRSCGANLRSRRRYDVPRVSRLLEGEMQLSPVQLDDELSWRGGDASARRIRRRPVAGGRSQPGSYPPTTRRSVCRPHGGGRGAALVGITRRGTRLRVGRLSRECTAVRSRWSSPQRV